MQAVTPQNNYVLAFSPAVYEELVLSGKHGQTGQNAFILLGFYQVAARRQKTNRPFVRDAYAMSPAGLDWGDARFYAAKRLLTECGYIKQHKPSGWRPGHKVYVELIKLYRSATLAALEEIATEAPAQEVAPAADAPTLAPAAIKPEPAAAQVEPCAPAYQQPDKSGAQVLKESSLSLLKATTPPTPKGGRVRHLSRLESQTADTLFERYILPIYPNPINTLDARKVWRLMRPSEDQAQWLAGYIQHQRRTAWAETAPRYIKALDRFLSSAPWLDPAGSDWLKALEQAEAARQAKAENEAQERQRQLAAKATQARYDAAKPAARQAAKAIIDAMSPAELAERLAAQRLPFAIPNPARARATRLDLLLIELTDEIIKAGQHVAA